VKLACEVNGKTAVIVGYATRKRSKIMAIVVCDGELRSIRLHDIKLVNLPDELRRSDLTVVPLPKVREVK
jgi:hypothetical protein